MATHDHAHDHVVHAPVTAHAHTIIPGADKAPAFAGLIVGGLLLFGILFGVVKLTQSRFGHEAGEKPAAAAEH